MIISVVIVVVKKPVADQSLLWVRSPMTQVISPSCADNIWSIKLMAPVLVSEGFLMDPPQHLPLVLHVLLWVFPYSQATQGGLGQTFLSFLGIINLLGNLSNYLKKQWLSLWGQTRISLSYRTKGSSVDHSLDMSSLKISATNASFSASSKFMGSWGGTLVGVRRSSPASRISSWPKIQILRVSPQELSLVRSSRVENILYRISDRSKSLIRYNFVTGVSFFQILVCIYGQHRIQDERNTKKRKQV